MNQLWQWVRAAEEGSCIIYIADDDGLHLYSPAGAVTHIVIADGVVVEASVTTWSTPRRAMRTPDALRDFLLSAQPLLMEEVTP